MFTVIHLRPPHKFSNPPHKVQLRTFRSEALAHIAARQWCSGPCAVGYKAVIMAADCPPKLLYHYEATPAGVTNYALI